MTLRYGIDTSILVRFLTGQPRPEYERCQGEIATIVEKESAEIYASNQVIGEAYVAVQHHYGVSKTEARDGLLIVLTSGLIAPLNGRPVLLALQESGGAGLVDRLIAEDYSRTVPETLTLDRRMAALPGVRLV